MKSIRSTFKCERLFLYIQMSLYGSLMFSARDVLKDIYPITNPAAEYPIVHPFTYPVL